MKSTYSVAVSKGFPYIAGDSLVKRGVVYNKFTKTASPDSPALFVGVKGSKFVSFERASHAEVRR